MNVQVGTITTARTAACAIHRPDTVRSICLDCGTPLVRVLDEQPADVTIDWRRCA